MNFSRLAELSMKEKKHKMNRWEDLVSVSVCVSVCLCVCLSVCVFVCLYVNLFTLLSSPRACSKAQSVTRGLGLTLKSYGPPPTHHHIP